MERIIIIQMRYDFKKTSCSNVLIGAFLLRRKTCHRLVAVVKALQDIDHSPGFKFHFIIENKKFVSYLS